jgi:pSer/pThr/pTyr-binding forkhead associated (FHA) protein
LKGIHAPKTELRIIEINSDGSMGKTVRIDKEISIGRGPCDLSYPDDASLATLHARLYKRQPKAYLKDLGTPNGTFVKQRQETQLNPGDVFVLGRQIIRFAMQRLDEGSMDLGTVVLTTPPKLQTGPLTAKLELIQLNGEVVKEFKLEKPETTIGRSKGDWLFPDDPYMSGAHARVVTRPGRFVLQDLNSRNGVYHQIHGEVELRDGDEFFLGEQRFRVELKAA